MKQSAAIILVVLIVVGLIAWATVINVKPKNAIVVEIVHADGTVDRLEQQSFLGVVFPTSYGAYTMKTTDVLRIYPVFTASLSDNGIPIIPNSWSLVSPSFIAVDQDWKSVYDPQRTLVKQIVGTPAITWQNGVGISLRDFGFVTYTYGDLNSLPTGTHHMTITSTVTIEASYQGKTVTASAAAPSVEITFQTTSLALSLSIYVAWGF